MSYKKPRNPQVEELTKSHKDRAFNISTLNWMIRDDGSRGCVWCGDPLKTKHHAARYCKDKLCAQSAYAWARPQGHEGRHLILIRQNFKCNICALDWRPIIEEAYQAGLKYHYLGWDRTKHYTEQFIWWIWDRQWPSAKIPREHRPEVDHIIPVYKGGTTLGLDNHQVICYACHKDKTKKDLKK